MKWEITLRNFSTGKNKTVLMPGGLSEAEARRCACIKIGDYWRAIDAQLIKLD